MYKYSKGDYMKLANVSCIDVALALGMTIDEGGKTTDKSVHIKDSGAEDISAPSPAGGQSTFW